MASYAKKQKKNHFECGPVISPYGVSNPNIPVSISAWYQGLGLGFPRAKYNEVASVCQSF